MPQAPLGIARREPLTTPSLPVLGIAKREPFGQPPPQSVMPGVRPSRVTDPLPVVAPVARTPAPFNAPRLIAAGPRGQAPVTAPIRATGPGPGPRDEEQAFRTWYADAATRYDLNPDPDSQPYDYRAAFRAGAKPDASGHWPSQFKKAGHPNEIVGGFNTRTGERVPGTPRAKDAAELVRLGWDAETAKKLASTPEPKPATFAESVGRGVDVAQQLGFGALEAAGELTGLDAVADVGRRGRQRNAAEIAGRPRAALADITGVGDFAQWAKETIGEQIPIMAPILASSAAGAAVGSVVPGIGTTIGGVIGAVVPSLAFGVGEVQTSIKERGEDQSAPGMAFLGGSAIAALDSILPAKIGSRLVKAFGGELAEEIAKRALLKPAADTMIRRTAKGAAAGFATEGFTEAVQEAVGDVAAALGTGTPVSPDLPRRMVEAGAAGALVGVVAAGAGAMPSARRTATPPVTVPPLGIVAREPLTATPTAPVTPTPVVAGTVTPPAVAPVVPPVVDLSPPKAERDEHKFSSTQVNLPAEHAARVVQMAKAIPDEDIAEDGRAGDTEGSAPHVTVKYGIHSTDVEDVRKVLANEPPITVTLGATSFFPGSESGNGDVVKIDVDSPGMHRLNAKIAEALETTDTHPTYRPHVTVAYVTEGKGQQYSGDERLKGQTMTLNAIRFSTKDGKIFEIPLTGATAQPTTREPWQQTRAEFRLAENQPRYDAIQAAMKAGTPIALTTHARVTRLVRPEHIRITSSGTVQIPRGRQWDSLTDQQVEQLAAQAGVQPVPFDRKVYHRSAVEEALQAGRDVPAAVLAEYPEFAQEIRAAVDTSLPPAQTEGRGAGTEAGTRPPDDPSERQVPDVEGSPEGVSEGPRPDRRWLPAPHEYPIDAFQRAKPASDTKRLTPEVTRELRRIVHELNEFPFVESTYTDVDPREKGWTGNAAGGHANIVGGAAGAAVYDDIQQFAPLNKAAMRAPRVRERIEWFIGPRKLRRTGTVLEVWGDGRYRVHVDQMKTAPVRIVEASAKPRLLREGSSELAKTVNGSRDDVQRAVQAILDGGAIHNNLAEGAVRVAERRAADDYRYISRPILPASWGEEIPADLEAALDAALAEEGEKASEPTPLTAESYRAMFGVTKEQAEATVAVYEAMGLPMDRMKVAKGGGGSTVLYQDAVAPPTKFYSRLIRAVEDNPQQKALGVQWKATIRNAKIGINQDEFALARVDDLIDRTTYTKQEVLDYLAANQVKVEDVTLGAPSEAKAAAEAELITASDKATAARKDAFEYHDGHARPYVGAHTSTLAIGAAEGDGRAAAAIERMDIPREHKDAILEYGRLAVRSRELNERVLAMRGKEDTHFDSYQLPGGDEGSYREVFLTVPDMPTSRLSAEENELKALNGRTWGDERTRGREPLTNTELARQRELQTRVGSSLVAKATRGGWRDGHSQYSEIPNPIVRLRFNTRTAGDRKVLFLEEVQPPSKDNQVKMPALLIKNWREIAFKWALRHAAENGLDAVAWTTGEQQAARYSLEKQVNAITWGLQLAKHPASLAGARRWVEVSLLDGGAVELQVKDDGTVFGTTGNKHPEFTGKALADVIGKEVAQRALDTEEGQLKGEGLKIGGEGLKKLYDVDFRNVVNGLPAVKKHGGKVGTVAIVIDKGGLPAYPERLTDEGKAKWIRDHPMVSSEQPALTLTPSMRDAIMGGQYLFQGPKASVEFTEHGDAIIRALENPNASSGVHEAAHVARRFLFDRSLPQDVREGITDDDILTAEEWAGATDGVWNREAEEKFARGFERYLADGEAPTTALQDLFDKFARWLAKVYTSLTGSPIDIEISPAMRQVFDRLITRSERLQTAEATGDVSFDVEAFESEVEKLYQDDDATAAHRKDVADIQRDLDQTIAKLDKLREAHVAKWSRGDATRAQVSTFNANAGALAERRDELRKMLKARQRPTVVDTLATGESQVRLPGAEDVREQDIKTPQLDAPFSLIGEVSKAKKGTQDTLFQGAGDAKRKRITLENLAAVAKRRGITIDAVRRVAEQAGYAVLDEGPRPVRAESGREIPPQKPIPVDRLHEFPSIQKMPSVIRADIEEMLQRYQGFEAQRRGVQSWDRTQELAKDMWLPLETLQPGKALNAEELSAYQTAIATALTMRKPLLEKIQDGSATDWNRLQASHLTDVATVLTASYRGAKAEAGRALNILRAKARVLDLRESAFLERAMKAPGFNNDLTKLSKEALDAAGDPLKQLEILRRRSATWFDYLQAIYYANLLSGMKTHLRNTIGNSFNVLAHTATPLGAAPVDALRSAVKGTPRSVYVGEIPQAVMGAFVGVQQGMKNALFTMRHGFRPKAVQAAGEGIFDTPRVELPGGLLNPVNIPGRSLEAADEFFRAIAWHQELYAGAYAQAKREGATDVSARMAELLTAVDPTTEDGQAYEALSYAADKFAARAVFQEEPGFLTNLLLKSKSPAAPKWVRATSLFLMPFIKTPAAILRQGFEWSPAGFAMRGASAGGREEAQALGRAALGSAFLLGPIAWLAATGRLTGAPPDDPGEREEFYAQGKLANAVRIGDYWVRYVLFQPFSVGMAAVANAWDKFKDSDQDQAAAEDAFITALAGAGASLMDQSFLSGLGTFIDAINEPKRYAGQLLSLFAQGLVPFSGLMRNVTQATDPVYRRPQGVLPESVQAIIPGQSETLVPRRGRFGEAAERTGPWWQRGFVVPEVSKAIEDDVTMTLAAVGYRPTTPRPELTLRGEKVSLAREQEDVLVEALGRERKWMVENIVRSPGFSTRDDDVKLEMLERGATIAGRAVRARALRSVSRKEPLRLDRLVSAAVMRQLTEDREALLGNEDDNARVAR